MANVYFRRNETDGETDLDKRRDLTLAALPKQKRKRRSPRKQPLPTKSNAHH